MLKLYHAPISPNSRRVWITLLEQNVEFELVEKNLDGDQFQPEFLAINPFHHIPVLDDDGFIVIESLAILDYLAAKYPTPALLPTDAKALAKVKMVELVTMNELGPATNPLVAKMLNFPNSDNPEKIETAKQKTATVLKFFEELLGNNVYFGGDKLTLGDIVAGCTIPLLPMMGVGLDEYPRLKAWCDRINQRPAWQTTQATPQMIEAFKERMQTIMAQRQ
ncbi:MAG TPA: glutathione S-transferase family protein [Nostocaceae cyanobacterium]|nr:glutathione S-transferase family protein [Nostocaceae cyanobacterium]